MIRVMANLAHSADFASVDEAFSTFVTETRKLEPAFTALGLSLVVDSENYIVWYKDSNNVHVLLWALVYATGNNYVYIRYTKDRAVTYYYGRVPTSSDTSYSVVSDSVNAPSSTANPPIARYQGANFYSGSGEAMAYSTQSRYTSSNYNSSVIGLSNSHDQLLAVFAYYNDHAAYFIVGESNDTSTYYATQALVKISGKLMSFPKWLAASQNSGSARGANLTSFNQLAPSETYSWNKTFYNYELNKTEKAVLNEVQIDAEGNTLGDEVYVGTIPAPNGRYYINNTPYFFLNGLGVKDPD